MKLTAIYARVSTARQEEDQTIKTQMAADMELIRQRGFKLVTEYVDEGWSGDILARPALDRLRQDARSKQWQVLVVYDPDRLARRYSYQELVMDELKDAGIEVVFVTVSTPQNSEEKILHGVRGLFAEYERAKISERFRLGKVRKVKEGHLLVSVPLYGYRYVSKQEKSHGYYEINEDEARVVRMIFHLVDKEGLTLYKLVRRLESLGIKPRKSRRGVWTTGRLSHLLRHKAYIGEAHWGGSYAVVPDKPLKQGVYRKIRKSSRRTKPEAEWITIPIPAIVSRDQFERVQLKIKSNRCMPPGNTKNEYLLAGKIFCSCGRRRTGEGPLRGKYRYYRCLDRAASFPAPRTCLEPGINVRTADYHVWNEFARMASSPMLLSQQMARWRNNQNEKVGSIQVDIKFLLDEVDKLKEQEARFVKAYGCGLLTLGQLEEYCQPLREKSASLEAQIHQAEKQQAGQTPIRLPEESEVAALAKEASARLKDLNYEAKKVIMGHLVQKVIGTKEHVTVTGSLPVFYFGSSTIVPNGQSPTLSSNLITSHVKLFSDDRHRQGTPRHEFNEANSRQIPFSIDVDLTSDR